MSRSFSFLFLNVVALHAAPAGADANPRQLLSNYTSKRLVPGHEPHKSRRRALALTLSNSTFKLHRFGDAAAAGSWSEFANVAITQADRVAGQHGLWESLISWSIWLVAALLAYRFGYTRAVPGKESGHADPKDTLEKGHFDCVSDPHIFFWAFLCPAIRWADTINLAGFMKFKYAFALFAAMSLLNYMNFYDVYIAGVFTLTILLYFCALKAIAWHRDYQEKKHDSETTPLDGQPTQNLPERICFWICVVLGVLAALYTVRVLSKTWDAESELYYQYMTFIGFFTWGCFTTAPMLFYRQRLRAMLDLPHNDFSTFGADCCFIFWCPCFSIAQEARAINEAYRMGHPAVAEMKQHFDKYGSLDDTAAGESVLQTAGAGPADVREDV